MKPVKLSSILLAGLVLVGCGHKHEEGDGHNHGKETAHGTTDDHGHEAESPSGASFKAGKGVMLTEETRQILGVEVVEVAAQKLPTQIRFNVQVFGEKHHHAIQADDHTGCDVHGSGFLPPDKAAVLRAGQSVQVQTGDSNVLSGVVLAIEPALALSETEVIVGLTNATDKIKPGEFLSAIITLPRDNVVTVIPRSALLRTAEGTFVYAVNGDAFFRTAVKAGSASGDLLEITDGLFAGDAVVTKPVETLYLIELRATKGGGHSH
jgi:hypothetical protein